MQPIRPCFLWWRALAGRTAMTLWALLAAACLLLATSADVAAQARGGREPSGSERKGDSETSREGRERAEHGNRAGGSEAGRREARDNDRSAQGLASEPQHDATRAGDASADAKHKPSEAKPSEAKPSEAKPSGVKPSGAKAPEAKAPETKAAKASEPDKTSPAGHEPGSRGTNPTDPRRQTTSRRETARDLHTSSSTEHPAGATEHNHGGVEVHNHLLGIPGTGYFVEKIGGGDPAKLFKKIHDLFHEPNADKLNEESKDIRAIVDATQDELARKPPDERQAYLLEQLDKILAASSETPFDQTYSVRDELIKKYIDPTRRGQDQGYQNFTADVIKLLAEDGIKYSEQSISAKKMAMNMTPRDLEAAHRAAAAAGKDSDLRFLTMMPTSTMAPGDTRDLYNGTLANIDKVLPRGDVLGIDIAGPEEGRFTDEGIGRFREMYEHVSTAAQERGRELVLRPHVGEGYAPVGAEDAAHINVARANLEMLLTGLEHMGYNPAKGKADGVIIRFGHATHATPEQIVRMKNMGIIAEANISSNLATRSISSLDAHPLLYNLYFDEPTILSTDGHGVMGTNLNTEYAIARTIIDDFKAGRTTIKLDGVEKQYQDLTPDQQARFNVEKLKTWATEYLDRIKAGDAVDRARKPGRSSSAKPGN
jgi:adenosine deaminase